MKWYNEFHITLKIFNLLYLTELLISLNYFGKSYEVNLAYNLMFIWVFLHLFVLLSSFVICNFSHNHKLFCNNNIRKALGFGYATIRPIKPLCRRLNHYFQPVNKGDMGNTLLAAILDTTIHQIQFQMLLCQQPDPYSMGSK